MEAVIFCGIQASGKSTYYRARFAATHVRINLDTLKTRRREREVVKTCLASGWPFVVDNTNLTASDRARYISPAIEAGFAVVGYFFDTTPREAIARNADRPPRERIPVQGTLGMYKRLEPPARGEGFKGLFRVRIRPEGGFEVADLRESPLTPAARQ